MSLIKNLISIGGTSTGLILPRPILELLQLDQGSPVVLDVDTVTQTLTIRLADADALKRREEFRKAQAEVLHRHGKAFRNLAKR